MSSKEDAVTVLLAIAKHERTPNDPLKGKHDVRFWELEEITSMDKSRLQEALKILAEGGAIEAWWKVGDNDYYDEVSLKPWGHREVERIETEKKRPEQQANSRASHTLVPFRQPVGSPYGFTEEDWEAVIKDREDTSRLIVVFGYKWDSNYYSAEAIRESLKRDFKKALEAASTKSSYPSVDLDFRVLKGGYGGHLFNQIARDIIGADIAVFDTSDLNPNVMIEMGIALTWGVRVLPIYDKRACKPPSDISGHTWAEYEENGSKWSDPDHVKGVQELIEAVLRKKPYKKINPLS